LVSISQKQGEGESMNKQFFFIIAAAFFGTLNADDALRKQLEEAYELECKQRAYDLMLELEVPLQEAQKIIAEESTPPDPRYYEHFYREEPVKTEFPERREPLMADLPPEEPGFPDHITDQALELVDQYQRLKTKYFTVINKEKVFTVEYVEKLIAAFKKLKMQIKADADVRRAVTIRVVPFLIRILQGKDVISYIDEYIAHLKKVLR